MAYDPDGDPRDLDLNDPEAAGAWLEHANTKAMGEDLGRAFVALPPAEQIAQLAKVLLTEVRRRDELASVLAEREHVPADDPLRALLVSQQDMVRRTVARISDLLARLE